MKSDGEYLGLVRPDGSIASALASEYPRQLPNVPYGIPEYPSNPQQYTLLNEPTPGGANSGPLESGPFIAGYALQFNHCNALCLSTSCYNCQIKRVAKQVWDNSCSVAELSLGHPVTCHRLVWTCTLLLLYPNIWPL